jgi:hypothetical protein
MFLTWPKKLFTPAIYFAMSALNQSDSGLSRLVVTNASRKSQALPSESLGFSTRNGIIIEPVDSDARSGMTTSASQRFNKTIVL